MNLRRPLAAPTEVAEFLGVAVKTLDMWAYRKRGEGPPYVKVGRLRRYRWSDVEAYVDQQTQGTGAA